MNQVLGWLAGGDLRGDGLASEVANLVLENLELAEALRAGLGDHPGEVRARAADALEKVARCRPDLVVGSLEEFRHLALNDPQIAVRMHLAMIFGHLAGDEQHAAALQETLLRMLELSSVFDRAWAISSLCILARKWPQLHGEILNRLAAMSPGGSAALRTRLRMALETLSNPGAPFPQGWSKSEVIDLG